jgi:hypothetical protein
MYYSNITNLGVHTAIVNISYRGIMVFYLTKTQYSLYYIHISILRLHSSRENFISTTTRIQDDSHTSIYTVLPEH